MERFLFKPNMALIRVVFVAFLTTGGASIDADKMKVVVSTTSIPTIPQEDSLDHLRIELRAQMSELRAQKQELQAQMSNFYTQRLQLQAQMSDWSLEARRLEEEFVSARSHFESRIMKLEAENKQLRHDLQHTQSPGPIYFTASLQKEMYNYTGILKPYSLVTNNTDDSGLNTTSGVFRAPVAGLYLFIASATTYYGDAIYSAVNMALMVDGQVVSTALAKSHGSYAMGTVQASLQLAAGQTVWLQSLSDLSFYEDGSTGFTGVLVRAG